MNRKILELFYPSEDAIYDPRKEFQYTCIWEEFGFEIVFVSVLFMKTLAASMNFLLI